ncbi:hypothetical protein C0992_003882 [Termitomyces sp. T32_za158]|nr:hypothetical protein C0992_003882 [Termitomyces sp. T32_za158]
MGRGLMSIMPPVVTPNKRVGQLKVIGAALVRIPVGFQSGPFLFSPDTFAAAWHGGLRNADQYAGDTQLRAAISSAMNFWFSQDFTIPACLDSGGTTACPCSTPGFWNQNWNSNIILIPTWVGQVCLLLENSLTASEQSSCALMTGRAYNTFQTGINGVSAITGANTLDIASIGIDLGLSTSNISLVSDAYARVHAELVIKDGIKADGIRADGSFGDFEFL